MSPYGLILGISFLVGTSFFIKKNSTIPPQKLNFFVFGTIISAVIGARLYHVIDQWKYYSQNLLQIPATWNGGLGIFGGILGALIFIFLFAIFSKISLLTITDSIAPILPLCQAIGRLGNLFNHEIPSWWAEASLNLVLFLLIKKSKTPTAHYLIGYGFIRFLIEFFRSDTWQINDLKVAQVASILFILSGIILILKAPGISKMNSIRQNARSPNQL